MRCSPLSRLMLATLAAAALSATACVGGGASGGADTGSGTGTTAADTATGGADNATTAGSDTTSGAETATPADTTGGSDTPATTDVATTGDTVTADATVPDGVLADTKPNDTIVGTDTKVDVSPDVAKPPFTCKADADCNGVNLGPCTSAKCDVAKGNCVVEVKADATACEALGPCGGKGTCKLGACNFVSPCAPGPCNAAVLKCSDKISLDAATMGASKMGVYACGLKDWTGGEKAYTLASDATQVAQVEIASTATWTVLDLAPNPAGLCIASKCLVAGPKLTLGLQPGKPRLLVVDSLGTGTATLTVTCAAGIPSCGDSKCDPKVGESCGNCAKDCGACKDPCPTSKQSGCAGNPCEACVCADDPYCCNTAWDSKCAGECKTCNAGKCGDGVCAAPETCSSCTQDCGSCAPAPAVCGDGKCDTAENCGTCPGDCGKCGNFACVCATDSYCCTTSFDGSCQTQCAKCAGGPCPKTTCGDGVCAPAETCTSCSKDCGACVTKCGDGKCEGAETNATCPADCTIGCKGHCGDSNMDAKGKVCWCDDACAESGDCCEDKTKFCP